MFEQYINRGTEMFSQIARYFFFIKVQKTFLSRCLERWKSGVVERYETDTCLASCCQMCVSRIIVICLIPAPDLISPKISISRLIYIISTYLEEHPSFQIEYPKKNTICIQNTFVSSPIFYGLSIRVISFVCRVWLGLDKIFYSTSVNELYRP